MLPHAVRTVSTHWLDVRRPALPCSSNDTPSTVPRPHGSPVWKVT